MSQPSSPKPMSKIAFTWKGRELEGILISMVGEKMNIKLSSGYNILVKPENVRVLGEMEGLNESAPKESGSDEASVSIITTGGTIVSKVDYRTGAVFPSMDIGELTSKFRYLNDGISIKKYEFSNLLSENMEPEHWIKLAKNTADQLKKSEGVVITHGTDTMCYTSAALSFMFQKQTGPIILTGSQRSSDRPSSDSFLNLEASVAFAMADHGEVGIAMHSGTSDDKVSLVRGTRARKMHSTRRDAFRSMGERPVGTFDMGLVNMTNHARGRDDEIQLNAKLEKKVGLIYFYPGLETDQLEAQMNGKKGVVIMGTGLGHIAVKYLDMIRERVRDGMKVMVATQCLNGTVDLDIYTTGRKMKEAGIASCYNMLPETAYVKMMYVLGNYGEAEFEDIMKKNLRGEILEREEVGFLL